MNTLQEKGPQGEIGLTEKSKEIFALSDEIASEKGTRIGLRSLFAAVTKALDNQRILMFLMSHGIRAETFKFGNLYDPDEGVGQEDGKPKLTLAVKGILENILHQARNQGASVIEAGHILLALGRHAQTVATIDEFKKKWGK